LICGVGIIGYKIKIPNLVKSFQKVIDFLHMNGLETKNVYQQGSFHSFQNSKMALNDISNLIKNKCIQISKTLVISLRRKP
jgi:hypothetical protein